MVPKPAGEGAKIFEEERRPEHEGQAGHLGGLPWRLLSAHDGGVPPLLLGDAPGPARAASASLPPDDPGLPSHHEV